MDDHGNRRIVMDRRLPAVSAGADSRVQTVVQRLATRLAGSGARAVVLAGSHVHAMQAARRAIGDAG
ncbi:MAG TPA: hypothetical protein VHK06_01175 [Candidatus Limnocylindria bacterium]|nr:hypothetical protein [Candidatus Limnocylindria bacterium]